MGENPTQSNGLEIQSCPWSGIQIGVTELIGMEETEQSLVWKFLLELFNLGIADVTYVYIQTALC